MFFIQWSSVPWKILIILSHFLLAVLQTQRIKEDAPFHHTAFHNLCANLDILCDQSKDILCEHTFNWYFSYCFQVFWVCSVLNWCIYRSSQNKVKSHLSPFTAGCAVTIALINNFFHSCKEIKSSVPKAKFRQAISSYKAGLEAAKAVYLQIKLKVMNEEMWLLQLLANC